MRGGLRLLVAPLRKAGFRSGHAERVDILPAVTLRSRTLAAIVSFVYLSAAFGDCERPVFTPVGVEASAHAGHGAAVANPWASADSEADEAGDAEHAAHTEHAAHASHSSLSSQSGHAGAGAHAGAPTSHHGPAHGRAHGPAHGRSHGESHHGPAAGDADTAARGAGDALAHRRGGAAPLELQAKCLCGCEETRSTIGGGASRLGSTIPAVYVPSLPPAAAWRGFAFEPGRFSRMTGRLDPIPI